MKQKCEKWHCLQMLYDSSHFWEESEEEIHEDDSEDSNAERHYTHEYPDEADSQGTEDLSECDSETEPY